MRSCLGGTRQVQIEIVSSPRSSAQRVLSEGHDTANEAGGFSVENLKKSSDETKGFGKRG